MLICAEDSGDLLAAELVDALRDKHSDIEFIDSFVGDACMQRGIKNTIASISSIAKMGFIEILSLIPTVFTLRTKILDTIEKQQPDCVILVDGFAFTHFIAKKIKQKFPHIKLVKYIAPKLWAWAPWRARKLQGVYNLILGCLPFEPEFFAQYNIKVQFVGHSVMQRFEMLGQDAKNTLRHKYQIPENKKIILLLPGSRSSEIKNLWPIFQEASQKFDQEKYHFILPIAPQKQHFFQNLPNYFTIITNSPERFKAFQIADAALAASGTVSLELMVAQVPTVIAYKVSWLSAKLASFLITVPYVTLLNIILHKEIYPEFLQENCTVDKLFHALEKMLNDQEYQNFQQQACIQGISSIQRHDQNGDVLAANKVAADYILDMYYSNTCL